VSVAALLPLSLDLMVASMETCSEECMDQGNRIR
jgi:hypothetical protein